MSKEPFFTIGVPIYNAEKYLPLCLDSILGQTFGDFELILVNDGSTDGSLEICYSYQEKDSRIVVIDQKNGGVSAATNRILDAASGRYLYLMDNDDEMYEGILQKAYEYLMEDEVDILHGAYYMSTPKSERKLRVFLNPDIQDGFATLCDYLRYETCVGFSPSMWSKFVRRAFWEEEKVQFQSKYDGCQDLDVSRRLIRSAKTIRYVEDIFLTWYHPREGSISTEWSYSMMRNYWRLKTDMIYEARTVLSGKDLDRYEEKIVRDSCSSLWRIPTYSPEQQCELVEIIAPVRSCFKTKCAPDGRTAFLLFSAKFFGIKNAFVLVRAIRALKHFVLRR